MSAVFWIMYCYASCQASEVTDAKRWNESELRKGHWSNRLNVVRGSEQGKEGLDGVDWVYAMRARNEYDLEEYE